MKDRPQPVRSGRHDQDQHDRSARSALRNLIIIAALCALTLVAYWPLGHAQFINYDDDEYITRNVWVQNGLSWEGFSWAWTTTHAANWHPLTWLSHMLDVELFGGVNAGAHHAVNVLIHVVNAILVFLTLMKMTGSRWRSALVAALFAIHPLHVESVAWVSERKDLLSTGFGLLAIFVYGRYVERMNLARYLPIVLCFALSLMCKPTLVTLPFVLLILDLWPLRRIRRLSALILEKLPLLALSIASCAVTLWAQHRGGAVGAAEVLPFSTRLANALISYVAYIAQMFWPVDLAVLYPYPHSRPVWMVGGAAVMLAGFTATVIVLSRKRPWLLVGWLWYLGTLVPMIGLVQVGEQARADRYTYVPLIGLFVMIAWSLPGAARAQPQKHSWALKASAVAAAIVITAFAAVTWRQSHYWRDSRTLFERTLAINPINATAHTNLAMALLEEQDFDPAAEHFRISLAQDPTIAEDHIGLAYIDAVLGNLDEAIRHYRDAIEIRADLAEAHHGLAESLRRQGRFDEAIVHYREALRINPTLPNLHFDFAQALGAQSKFDEAMEHLRKAAVLQPDHADASHQLGLLLANRHRWSEAIEAFRRVAALRPEDSAVRNNLARLLLAKSDRTEADVREAVNLAQQACEIDGRRDPRLLDTLAAALAEAGNLAEAVEAEKAALERAKAAGDQALIDALQANLDRYQAAQRVR